MAREHRSPLAPCQSGRDIVQLESPAQRGAVQARTRLQHAGKISGLIFLGAEGLFSFSKYSLNGVQGHAHSTAGAVKQRKATEIEGGIGYWKHYIFH